MEDKVLSERDIHGIVKILKNSDMNIHLLCGALGLSLEEHEEISRRVDRERSDSYLYFRLVLNKWIEINSDGATLKTLAGILRNEKFRLTAGNSFAIILDIPDNSGPVSIHTIHADKLERLLTANTPNNTTENKLTIENESNEPRSSTGIKRRITDATAGTSDQLKRVRLDDSQQGQFSGSMRLRSFHGSHTELNDFFKMSPQRLDALRSVEFDTIEMSWSHFWNYAEHLQTLESIKLTNVFLLDLNNLSPRKLLPNMEKYIVRLNKDSSKDLLKIVKQGQENLENPGQRKYLLETLIPFAKNRTEEVWNTCCNLSHIGLYFYVPSYNRNAKFKIDYDTLKFSVDRSYVQYYQNSTSTGHNILPKFFQTFQGVKKLRITNYGDVLGCLDFSSIPSQLTHLKLIDDPTLTNGGEFDVALKSFKDLKYLDLCDAKFGSVKHRIDLANLSQEIRHLILGSADITCSSQCKFKNLSVLEMNYCHFESSVIVPSMFKNIKKCYFDTLRGVRNPLSQGLKEWLEIDTLEFILMREFRIDKNEDVREILSTYGVPPNLLSFALEKFQREWRFVSSSSERILEIFREVFRADQMDMEK